MATIKALFDSKKFISALAGIAFVVSNKVFGWEISEDMILQILSMVGLFIVGQGIADLGKEKAKVEKSA